MNSTARLGLQKPQTSDAATGLRTSIGQHADALDDAAIDLQGTLAARPTSTPGSPGKRGRYYFATDTKQLFRDSGTGWDEIQVGPVAKADLATDALNAFLKLATSADRKAAFGRYNTPAFGGATQITGSFPHGLGATPVIVQMTTQQGASAANPSGVPMLVARTSVDATNIGYICRYGDGSTGAAGTIIDWLAIA